MIYCSDCTFFVPSGLSAKSSTIASDPALVWPEDIIQRTCSKVVDTRETPIRQLQIMGNFAILNKDNACPHFEAKEVVNG